MRITVVGSRKGFTYEEVESILSKEISMMDTIETGGAPGVDTYAKQFADSKGVYCHVTRPIYPDKRIYYLFRDVEMVAIADRIIAVWDGKSKGTKFTIDYAKARNRDIKVITKFDK